MSFQNEHPFLNILRGRDRAYKSALRILPGMTGFFQLFVGCLVGFERNREEQQNRASATEGRHWVKKVFCWDGLLMNSFFMIKNKCFILKMQCDRVECKKRSGILCKTMAGSYPQFLFCSQIQMSWSTVSQITLPRRRVKLLFHSIATMSTCCCFAGEN